MAWKDFRSTRKDRGPAWLTTNGESGAVGYILDTLKDAFVESHRQALLARFPQQNSTGTATAADDALAAIGRDRRVVRGINETSQSYAARLVRWLDDRQTAGSAFALLQKLAEYTGPLPSWRTVDARGSWYSRAADGTTSVLLQQYNWHWDHAEVSELARWSRFWVICYPNGLWAKPGFTCGAPSTTAGSGLAVGTTATPSQIATMRAIVADWKPEGTRCVNIILAFDSASFAPTTARDGTGLPDGNWGNWSKVSARVHVPSRLPSALYCAGV